MNMPCTQAFTFSDPALARRYHTLTNQIKRRAPAVATPDPTRLLFTMCVALVVAIFFLMSKITKPFSLEIVGSSSYYTYTPTPFSSGKSAFLAKFYPARRQSVSSQVEYIAKIISSQGKRNLAQADFLARSIVSISEELKYDPLFVAAVIKYESTFQNRAVSSVGAVGLMQILPSTAQYISQKNSLRWFGKDSLYNTEHNIRLGISYLKYLEQYFSKNPLLVLIAYNWGPGNLQEALKNKKRIPSSPIQYARQILKDHQSWAGQLALFRAGNGDAV